MMNGTTLIKAFVPLTGGASAVYTSGGLAYYRHTDHLGTSRLASTPTNTVYSDTAYSAFGEPYAQSGAIDPSFTGQNQDTTAGLYDFLFREQDPNQGRWASPDPAGLAAVDPANPQSWNRYSYVFNSPLNFIDPLGLCGGGTFDPGGPCVSFSYKDENGCTITVTYVQMVGWDGFTYDIPQLSAPVCPGDVGSTGGPPMVGGGGGGTPNTQKFNSCIQQFYNSPAGKVVESASVLSTIPGFNPNWKTNLVEFLFAGLVKKPTLGGLSQGKDYPSIITGAANTEYTSLNKAFGTANKVGEKIAPFVLLAGAITDLAGHATCNNIANGYNPDSLMLTTP